MEEERGRFTTEILEKAKDLRYVKKLPWLEVARRCGCKMKSLKSTLSQRKSGVDKGLNDIRKARTEIIIKMYLDENARICDIARKLLTTPPVIKRKLLSLGLDEEVRRELTQNILIP